MKKLYVFIILFLIYTLTVKLCPVVNQWDISIIEYIQNRLKDIPLTIPLLMDNTLYSIAIFISVTTGLIYFFRKYLLIDLFLFVSSPLVAYLCNIVIKNIVQRPRPDLDIQTLVQPSTYSFVSSHTLVTATLFGLTIFYLKNYCKNDLIKNTGILFSVSWIILEGFSRIWIGVHNPTDVIGGYFLALILIYIYVKLIKLIGGKN